MLYRYTHVQKTRTGVIDTRTNTVEKLDLYILGTRIYTVEKLGVIYNRHIYLHKTRTRATATRIY